MNSSASQMWLLCCLEMQTEHTFICEPCNRSICKPTSWPRDININLRMHLCHIQIGITYGCQMVQYHPLQLPPNMNSCCFSSFWSAHHAANKLDQILDMTGVLMYLLSVRSESSSDSPSDCRITRSYPRQESGIYRLRKEEKGQLTGDSPQIVRLDKV